MYLVYQIISTDIYPICICNTAADAEEMCLSLAWESYYHRWYINEQIAIPKGYSSVYTTAPSLINCNIYRYKEVPYVG